MYPRLLTLGEFTLHTYGVMVALGFLAGLWMTTRLGRGQGLDTQRIYDLGIYCAVAAIVGAKVLLVIEDWRYYAAQPSAIFSRDLFQAAGVFYGGFLAALGVAAWYMRRHGLPFLATADAFVPGVALGHSIGRLGCFFAGCCWGKPTSASWAVVFRDPYAHRMFGVPLDTPLHPAQLYESGAVLLLFLVLLAAYQRHRFPGQVLALYLMLYGGVRFVLEFTRDRAGFSLSQGIALALVVAGVALGKVARRRWPALGR